METMEVVKINQDSEFSYKDLIILHKECMGGKFGMTPPGYNNTFEFECQRCLTKFPLYPEEVALIIKTAIDGQERNFRYGQKIILKK